jgi:hypothetical protein
MHKPPGGPPTRTSPVSCRILTRLGCQQIVRDAFEYAKKYGYKTVTLVEKPNVVRETSGLMVREARKIAKDYPGIELWETNIDAMCMWLIKNPENYGVLVSSNMFGDIISDLCAQLVGGLGFACSGNIGDDLAIFEPSHGSAPKYVGLNKVNPIAMILSAKMMLDHLGEKDLAARMERAVAELSSPRGRSAPMTWAATTTTTDMAAAIAARIHAEAVQRERRVVEVEERLHVILGQAAGGSQAADDQDAVRVLQERLTQPGGVDHSGGPRHQAAVAACSCGQGNARAAMLAMEDREARFTKTIQHGGFHRLLPFPDCLPCSWDRNSLTRHRQLIC